MAEMSACYTLGTMYPAQDPDMESACLTLHAAISDAGSVNEDVIIQVLLGMNNDQRQQLKYPYHLLCEKDLTEDLSSHLSNEFSQSVAALMMTPIEFDVFSLNKAFQEKEDKCVLVDLLCTQGRSKVEKMISTYSSVYNTSVEEAVTANLKGDFLTLILSVIKTKRSGEVRYVEEEVDQDVSYLSSYFENPKKHEVAPLLEILTQRSYDHIREVCREYQKVTGTPLEKSAEKEPDRDLRKGVLSILMYSRDPLGYYSARIMKSMKGIGTDDDSLIRLIVSRAEIDLSNIKSVFLEAYGKPLADWISSDTSGSYQRLLLRIVGGNGNPVEFTDLDLTAQLKLAEDGDGEGPPKPFMPSDVY